MRKTSVCIGCGRHYIPSRSDQVFHSQNCGKSTRHLEKNRARINAKTSLRDGSYVAEYGQEIIRSGTKIHATIKSFLKAKGLKRILGYQLVKLTRKNGQLYFSSYPYIARGRITRLNVMGKLVHDPYFAWEPFEDPLVAEAGTYRVRVKLAEGLELLTGKFDLRIALPGCAAVTRCPLELIALDESQPVAQPEVGTAPVPEAAQDAVPTQESAAGIPIDPHPHNFSKEIRTVTKQNKNGAEQQSTGTEADPEQELSEEDIELALEFIDIVNTRRIQKSIGAIKDE